MKPPTSVHANVVWSVVYTIDLETRMYMKHGIVISMKL